MVLNDAGIEISDGARRALVRGLSFTPNCAVGARGIESSSEQLRRSINLRLFWSVRETRDHKSSLISRIIKSGWQPPETLRATHPFWLSFQGELLEIAKNQRLHYNFPRHCLVQWKAFTRDKRIYVVKADKGGKTVIWKRSDYVKEAERLLDDKKTYVELTKEEAEKEYAELRNVKKSIIWSLRHEGCVSAAEGRRLELEEVSIPAFYILPKIHKEKRADTGTFPGRPITAAVGGMMKTLDEYLADTTAPLLRLIPGSLIDTADLLRELEKVKNLPTECQLFSADVESLYPSIPWQEGLDSATDFYTANLHVLHARAEKEKLLPPPSPVIFRRILELVLMRNIFQFQDRRFFRQLQGTAMGCSMSVFLANTFMFKRTRHLLENPPNGLRGLWRYIDDLIGIWEGDKEQIPQLFSRTVDDDVRLTYVYGGRTLEALDITLWIRDDGSIATKLYRKPTDGHQYVHWSSAHPEKLKASIPYAQLLRIKRNCSENEDYHREAEGLLARFRLRGYPESVLISARNKAHKKDRKELLVTGSHTNKDTERLTFITDNLNGLDSAFRKSISKFYSSLEDNLRRTEIGEHGPWPFPPDPPRLASRTGKSLGSSLGPTFKRGPQTQDE